MLLYCVVPGLVAAIFATLGSGARYTLEEAIDAMKLEYRIFEPDPLTELEYNDCYQRWISAAERLEKPGEVM